MSCNLYRRAIFVSLMLVFPLPIVVSATSIAAKVVRIVDGDTIELLHNNQGERVRLHGIDCPEKGQAYGNKAKHAVSSLVFGKEVRLRTHGKDKYGRTIADVFLPDGTNVNYELVKGGWCWWYRKYAPLDVELEALEKAAREAKKGLWVDPAPIPPWTYRKTRRGGSLDMSNLLPFETPGDSHIFPVSAAQPRLMGSCQMSK